MHIIWMGIIVCVFFIKLNEHVSDIFVIYSILDYVHYFLGFE